MFLFLTDKVTVKLILDCKYRVRDKTTLMNTREFTWVFTL